MFGDPRFCEEANHPEAKAQGFFLPAGRALRTCPAGPKIALRFRVCVCVCVCVCSSTNITCAKLRHSATMPL